MSSPARRCKCNASAKGRSQTRSGTWRYFTTPPETSGALLPVSPPQPSALTFRVPLLTLMPVNSTESPIYSDSMLCLTFNYFLFEGGCDSNLRRIERAKAKDGLKPTELFVLDRKLNVCAANWDVDKAQTTVLLKLKGKWYSLQGSRKNYSLRFCISLINPSFVFK